MKIALVLEDFDPLAGGLAKWTHGLAAFLIGRGHDVHVVAFSQANHVLPVHVTLVPPATGIWRRGEAIEAALRGLGADVVHDTGSSWSGDVFHPQTGSRLLSQARLVACHSLPMRVRSAISPVSISWRQQMKRLERRQVRSARRIIAVSRLVRQHLQAMHGLRDEQITLISNGVDTDLFAASKLDPLRQEFRARLGVADRVLYLASAFNMHLKGVDVAIKALGLLAAEGADVRLAVAGGQPDAQWRQLVAECGVADRVTFLGTVADMRPLFAAADALVHATRWDAGSLSTVEGQASGLPVITTAMNGAADLIEDGATGFVLPDPENVGALADRMRLLLDPTTRRRIGSTARQAAAGFDVRFNLAAVEQVLLEAAEAREPNLAEVIRRRFAALGGVELESHPPTTIKKPPSFEP